MALRVALVDDQTLFREGLAALLNQSGEVDVVAECTDGAEVPDLLHTVGLDVLVIDVMMPGTNGIGCTRQLADHPRRPAILALTAHAHQHYLDAMLTAGADGFIAKNSGYTHC